MSPGRGWAAVATSVQRPSQLPFALEGSRAILGAVGRMAALSSPAFALRAENLPAFVALVGFVLCLAASVAGESWHRSYLEIVFFGFGVCAGCGFG
jgi:hypothetical protein